ncbi:MULTISPECIES: C45 family autoproteolytic acyltransferase/hydolase [unclassified Ornithinimicrobium]|uniref:C45 family autoproteolytic acyltransferase/hydolase n=1 Tax=unclassified Ornithinimicrobium TaxID=2615080 RepID=UPI003853CFBB
MPGTVAPHRVPLQAFRIGAEDHRERGLVRGVTLAASIRATARRYAGLFVDLGISEVDQRAAADASLAALRVWAPRQHEEILGIAHGAELDVLDLGLTLARTEILTLAEAAPGECSTVAHQSQGASVSAQTWDWYAQFSGCWHAHRVDPLEGELAHAGFAEHGMPAKIGMNAAGVGVHLNILKHRDDSPGGVPVHSVLNRVLSEAGSVAEGLEIIRSAPTTSSSVLTLVGADRVAMVEVAPGRVSVLDGEGWRVHTNHFLARDQQEGALLLNPESDTRDRLAYLEGTTGRALVPRTPDELIPLLCSPLDQGGVALLPDETKDPKERLATLVTVVLDPARRRVQVSPGVPQHAHEANVTYHL